MKSLVRRFDRLEPLIDRSLDKNLMFIKAFQPNMVRKLYKLKGMVNAVTGLSQCINVWNMSLEYSTDLNNVYLQISAVI